ncbi:MAG: recombination-associated protein RdgC [Deltaproteobacteria bacterium]|jgi:DNA recombination-dependent growth factor C|nr:recombination-associated protein RdgC [Deltaproteobacteria bacterium]
MGFVKGGATFTRYRIFEMPETGLTDDFIGGRLNEKAFVDIEETSEESSLGWVRFFDHLQADFTPESFRFGELVAFNLRLDERKLSNKILNRYMTISEARFRAQTGRKPNSVTKKEMKEALRLDLLKRSLLDTKLIEVVWLTESNEVWLGAAGEKNRALFEEVWGHTFGLGIRLMVPVTIGLEILKKPIKERLMALKDPTYFGGGE